jgi:LysM repeat protein
MARHYTVQAGDTLSEIARRFYGDASLFKALANANNIADPNKIKTGQVLTLPDPPGRWYPVTSTAYFGGVIVNTFFGVEIPVGMRLVIENISGRYTGRNWVLGAAQLWYEPSDPRQDTTTWGYFPWIQCGPEHDPPDGEDHPEIKERYFGFSHSVRLYVDGPLVYQPHKGLQMICPNRRTAPGAYLVDGEYTLSGYLEVRSDF